MESDKECDPGKKYVSVVYHHISYQNDTGHHSRKETEGLCHLVPTDEKNMFYVPDYLPLAVIAIVVFLPCGVMSIHNSMKARKAMRTSELMTAMDASDWALQYALISFFVGPLLFCTLFFSLYVPLQF
ncbi:hypothetical protein ACF0H5_015964 [Mactra antiquata]